MKFFLVDRIVSVEPGRRIVTRKALSLAEEYLADHFPTFPVMPGVLMLEAMVQSAAWLVRVSEDCGKSMIGLEEEKKRKEKRLVSPGQTLELTAEAIRIEASESEFKAWGRCEGREMVKTRLRLRHYNLADGHPDMAGVDRRIVADARRRYDLLGGQSAARTASEAVL